MRKFSAEAFLEACGAGGPLLFDVRRDGDAEGRRLAVQQPFALVGRAVNADLVLKDARVSRRHIYLQVLAGRICWVNLGGLAGNNPAEESELSGWWYEKQTICVGTYQVQILPNPLRKPDDRLEGLDPLAAGSASNLHLPTTYLEFLRGDQVRMRWRMDRLLVLMGNALSCKIRLAGTEVSRFHCSLVATPQGTWLVDLLGRGGVLLNGVAVRFAHLEDGDVMQVGENVIHVRYAAARSAPGSALALADAPTAPATGRAVAVASPGGKPATDLAVPPFQPIAQDPTVQALIMPMLSQFHNMQQQMLDQFQTALLQTLQLFSTLHKDQMSFLRDELDRQRVLTQELRELQAELARLQAQPRGTGATAAAVPTRADVSPAPAAAPPRSEPTEKPAAAPEPAPLPAPATAGLPEQTAVKGANGVRPSEGQDVHAWLNDRMATLQQERQSSWQRILNFLGGKRPEG